MARFFPVFLLTACAVTATATFAHAKSYNVSGATIDELFASLEANGPGDGWAETNNSWAYDCSFQQSGQSLVCKTATVTHKSEVMMPNWPGYAAASKCMKDSWNAMYAALKKHEDKHVALAKGVDAKIKSALLAIPGQELDASPDDLSAALKTAADPVIAANDTVQQKFDDDTGHGKNDPTNPVILKACP